MSNQNKQDEKQLGVNPVIAVLTGAVIGAGVAVAGTVALSDKKNRDKVKEVLSSAKNKTVSYMEDKKQKAQDKSEEVEKKLTNGKKEIKKNILKESKKS